MNVNEFKSKYSEYLLDKKGRINANLSRCKMYDEIKNRVLALTPSFHESIQISDRLLCIINNIDNWPSCEVCERPVKMTTGTKFTAFCSFKCSRSKGSSTFTKAQTTCLEKYGVKSNLVTKQQLQSRRDNGGIGAANVKTRDKIRLTNLSKYGVENVFQSETIKGKIKDTHYRKYGGNYHTMLLGDKILLLQDKKYCTDLAEKYCLNTVSEMLGVAPNTVYKYFEDHGIVTFNSQRSNQEVEMFEFLLSIGIDRSEIVLNSRNLLNNKLEIDIFLPKHSIGIELHGLYWHSEKAGCIPGYHKNKKDLAIKNGIFLIQVFESEWVLKNAQVRSRILSLLGLNRKIHARQCEVRVVPTPDKKSFINANHLQGDCNSSINLGLYHNDSLVACATFNKTRFDKSADFELLRFCCISGISVNGGFNKLISAFNKLKPCSSIVSYADLRWSYGKLYSTTGFNLIGESKPAYHYFKGSSLVLENRIKFQKHKLQNLLSGFDPTLSEWDNMKCAGYNRIWDCGTTKWILNPNK